MNTKWEYYKRQYMHCDFDVLGSEGWELAAVITDPSHTGYGQYMCVFKRLRIIALESRSSANEVQNAERAQFEKTIAQQKAKIEELEALYCAAKVSDPERMEPIDLQRRRIVELEKNLVEKTRECMSVTSKLDNAKEDLRRANSEIGILTDRVGELEKRLMPPAVVDGKTPREVYSEAFRSVPLQISPQDAIEYAAKAVLETFGKRQTWDALERVRRRVLGVHKAIIDIAYKPSFGMSEALEVIDDELAKLGTENPKNITIPDKPTKPVLRTAVDGLESLVCAYHDDAPRQLTRGEFLALVTLRNYCRGEQ